ncbi:hypothetical protein XENOCAPTIV_022309, partial [Xenoophorus captivus]
VEVADRPPAETGAGASVARPQKASRKAVVEAKSCPEPGRGSVRRPTHDEEEAVCWSVGRAGRTERKCGVVGQYHVEGSPVSSPRKVIAAPPLLRLGKHLFPLHAGDNPIE